jgi:regulator of sigma E protease
MGYVGVVLVVGLLITIHEAGHLLAAKLAGVPVARFSVGFGRAILSRTWRGTEYRLGVIPVGGYVLPRLASEHEYLALSLWRRVTFSLGGPAANVAGAVVALAAMNAVNGHTSAHALFVAPFVQAAGATAQILTAFAGLFSRPEAVSGVVGIVAGGGAFVGASLSRLLAFAGIVGLNLGVLNLLPLPPLDGGKVLLDALERLFPRARRAYVPVVLVGWLFVIGLMIYATAMDVRTYVVG